MNKIIIIEYEESPEAIRQFKENVYRLWADHIAYTRNAIISTIAGLDDLGAVSDRLMLNQEQIGQLIAPYYGDDAATALTNLLKEHIDIASKIVVSARDSKPTDLLEAQWQENAIRIAEFLDSADPDNWPKADVLNILQKHLQCTLDEIKARINKDWATDFKSYDQCAEEIMDLAKAMVLGILDKFPEAFIKQHSSKTIKRAT